LKALEELLKVQDFIYFLEGTLIEISVVIVFILVVRIILLIIFLFFLGCVLELLHRLLEMTSILNGLLFLFAAFLLFAGLEHFGGEINKCFHDRLKVLQEVRWNGIEGKVVALIY